MRLALVSDTHLGHARGTPREGDPYFNLKQAFEGIVAQAPDAIIIPGDLFDHKIPEQEVWNECFDLFSILQRVPASTAKITHHPRNESPIQFQFHGIPVIAIAGTHEYRSKDHKNALQVLHTAGVLTNLHAAHAMIEKNGEKVAVHGMAGIPEKRALEALRVYNPKPLPGAHNLLVLHQSIKEFLPKKDDMVATIGLEDLPSGFDLLVNGHLHWSTITEWENKRLLIPGSTVFTQMKRLESEKPKGWYIYDTQSKDLRMHYIPKQRRLYYHKLKFKGATPDKIVKICREVIAKDLTNSHELLPLYRLKLAGALAKGFTQADVDFSQITRGFEDKAHFSCMKKFTNEKWAVRLEELRALHRSNASISSIGIELLEKNILRTPLGNRMDVKRLFELLENKDDVDKAIKLLQEGELVLPEKEEKESLPLVQSKRA